jgi:hypothetical protein
MMEEFKLVGSSGRHNRRMDNGLTPALLASTADR